MKSGDGIVGIGMRTARRLHVSVLVLTVVLGVVAYGFYPTAHGASPTNIALPRTTTGCGGSSVLFNTALTASNLTNVNSWQVNITYTPSQVALMNYTFGSYFTGQAYSFAVVSNSSSTGSILLGWTLYHGVPADTTTSRVTMATLTWKTLTTDSQNSFHIVTSSQDQWFGTELLNPSYQQLSYSTTDGSYGCTAPNVYLPLLEGRCYNSNAQFNDYVYASNLTSTHAWQVNVTFFASEILANSYSIGSSFTGSNTRVSNITNNHTGTILVNFTFTNTASVTSASTILLFSITFKTLVYHAWSVMRVVLSTENTKYGTYLWNTLNASQAYVETDGDLSCQV